MEKTHFILSLGAENCWYVKAQAGGFCPAVAFPTEPPDGVFLPSLLLVCCSLLSTPKGAALRT